MKVTIINESGFSEAMLGLSLSYNQPAEKMASVSAKLYNKNKGHNKFLESLIVWVDINAPRYFWQQFDTYRVGITKQSESTMHTMLKRTLEQSDFEKEIFPETLNRLNSLIEKRDFDQVKIELPESFLQRRVLCMNYMTLRRIIIQRYKHKLAEWKYFCKSLLEQIKYKEYVVDLQEHVV